jgi:hypothetical protein
MTTYTFDENTVSDLHKDARGYRPVAGWWEQWNSSTDAEKQEIWDLLIQEFSFEQEREESMKAAALQLFRDRIEQTYSVGATDLKTALKWIFQAEMFDVFDLQYGADYVCIHFGLDYTTANAEFPFQEVCNELLNSKQIG